MKRRVAVLLALLAALVPAAVAAGPAAAAPGQDDYPVAAGDYADNLTWNTSTTSGFTRQAGEPGWCQQFQAGWSYNNYTAWYRIRGTGGPVTISTEGSGADFDTMVIVYKAAAGGVPGDFVACADDEAAGRKSRLQLQTVAGQDYLVQAGGCSILRDSDQQVIPCDSDFLPYGYLVLTLLGNDHRAQAESLAANTRYTRTNWLATADAGEVLSCRGVGYHSTVWFRYDAPARGTVTAAVSGGQTVVSIYQGDSPAAADCGAGPANDQSGGSARVVEGAAGPYYVQVGVRDGAQQRDTLAPTISFAEDLDVDGDGRNRRPEGDDCDDGNASIRPGVTDELYNDVDEDCSGSPDKDADDDGHDARFAGGDDCDDKNPRRHPKLREIPNNGRDENCDGKDAPGQLPSTVKVSFRNDQFRDGRIFARMYIQNVRKGYRVRVTCRGSSACPKTFRKKVRRRGDVRIDSFRSRLFKRGTLIEVFVTARGNVMGFYNSYKVTSAGRNPRQRFCKLHPDKPRKPVKCR